MKRSGVLLSVILVCSGFSSFFPTRLSASKPDGKWTLYPADHGCSLIRNRERDFIVLSLSAEGQRGLRFHQSKLAVPPDVRTTVQLSAGDKTFAITAIGARTSDGMPGIVATTQQDIFAALSSVEHAMLGSSEIGNVNIDLSGLADVYPSLVKCVEPLKKRDPSQIPAISPKLVHFPALSRDDFDAGKLKLGKLVFKIFVSPAGLVDECRVIQSTGVASVDDKVCSILKREARFAPATNEAGNAIASTYQSSVAF